MLGLTDSNFKPKELINIQLHCKSCYKTSNHNTCNGSIDINRIAFTFQCPYCGSYSLCIDVPEDYLI